MTILQIIDTLAIGGAEKVLVNLANLQKRKGHEVCVLTILEPGPLISQLLPEIPQVSLHRQWKFSPFMMYRFIRLARKYDVIHVHSSHNLRYIFLASRLFGLKKVIFFHEHFGNIEIDRSVKWHQRLIYPKVQLIGVSRKICHWALEKVKMPVKNVHLLPNTVPFYPYHPKPPKNETRKYFSIVLTSNIRRPKNLEFALRLSTEWKDSILTIIGQPFDKAYEAELQEQILKSGISERIRFIHDCADIQPQLHQFDLAIHTAVTESGPLVLIEYLAQGIPFLSYRTGEIAYTVEEEFPDFIIDNFQTEQWVARISHLLSMDRQSLGKAMRRFYEARFSEESYYEQCQKIYHKGLLS